MITMIMTKITMMMTKITMNKMKRNALFLAIVLAVSVQSLAQSQLTTFILVRHAEKGDDGTKDPDLSEDGKKRANRLAEMLAKTSITAIYSTAYKRTRNTVWPLANAKGLGILSYDPLKGDVIDKMLNDHVGGTVVISGHSNTIPWTANYLTGKNDLKDFADNDYKNFLVVSVLKKGTDTQVTWLTY
ncbi:MAG TPA: phosphoglycerate mutase family protein [Chryseolinea sp.]|nr:phosphoglycerate mutase family protein [Chryseolinea sp.]